jgi:acetoin utilization deacetylase AcuC-like enzyme
MAAVDAVLDGTVRNAYALVRPPGHHAVADMGMGFCLFGNVALAAMHARQARGLERVAVVDWDVHHGNGTQAAFYEDPSVLTISVHQDSVFPPGSGPVTDNGAGAGTGANINIPMPPGSGNGAYDAVFADVVHPALERFRPELILVASGFDASAMDPLGRMMLTAGAFGRLTAGLMGVADAVCDGRLVVAHEGGYSEELTPFCALAMVEALSGIETDCRDTILHVFPEAMAGHELQPHQAEAVARAAALVEHVPAGAAGATSAT